MSVMFAEDGPVMTFLAPFITEPIGFDRVLDVTLRNGRKDQGGTVFSASDSIGDKFAKSFAYILDGVKPGVFVSADKISGAIGKDLTKGGKALNLKDELLALFAGTRIIRIDVKKDLKYFGSEMNRLLRAVDENEQFYNVNNYANNTPNKLVKTYEDMQEEAFRVQKDMFIRMQDLKLLDLSDFQIDEILKEAGVSETIRSNLMFGEFTPVNYSQKRFETKVNTIRNELDKMSTDGKFRLDLNTDFVFPEFALDSVKMNYEFKKFFKEGNEYNPEKFDYVLDKKGNMILDENGDPIKDDGFIKSTLRKISPVIKKGFNKLVNPLSNDFRAEAPPLPPTPQPIVNNTMLAKNDGLTRTENALLSEGEKEIAKRV